MNGKAFTFAARKFETLFERLTIYYVSLRETGHHSFENLFERCGVGVERTECFVTAQGTSVVENDE